MSKSKIAPKQDDLGARVKVEAEAGSLTRTLKDLFAGAAGGVAQVLLGGFFFFFFFVEFCELSFGVQRGGGRAGGLCWIFRGVGGCGDVFHFH